MSVVSRVRVESPTLSHESESSQPRKFESSTTLVCVCVWGGGDSVPKGAKSVDICKSLARSPLVDCRMYLPAATTLKGGTPTKIKLSVVS